jgi:hypothetical protein
MKVVAFVCVVWSVGSCVIILNTAMYSCDRLNFNFSEARENLLRACSQPHSSIGRRRDLFH